MPDYSATQKTTGGTAEGITTIANTINDFLEMKNNLAEKKQKREMQDLQMQQMRMQLQGQQRSMQEQNELDNKIKSIEPFKKVRVPMSPEELPADFEDMKSSYTPEEIVKRSTKEVAVPLSTQERLQKIVDIQLQHKAAQNPELAIKLLKEQRLAQLPQKVVAAMQEFEGVTGIDPTLRGTPEYVKSYMDFKKDKSAATREQPSYDSWSPDEKKWWFETTKSTGQFPSFGWGDKVSRSKYSKEYAGWNSMAGVSGAEAGAGAADYKGLSRSIGNQRKVQGMMGGFVENLNKQITEVNKLYDEVSRIDVRLLDKPWREINMYAVGSGKEKVIDSYLMEISREIGKLSTGSSASIAELSVDAQKKWDKIHDGSLALKELKLILDATRDQANMRYSSTLEQIESDKNLMKYATKSPKVKPLDNPAIIRTIIQRAESSLKAKGVANPTKSQIRDESNTIAIKEGYSVEK